MTKTKLCELLADAMIREIRSKKLLSVFEEQKYELQDILKDTVLMFGLKLAAEIVQNELLGDNTTTKETPEVETLKGVLGNLKNGD